MVVVGGREVCRRGRGRGEGEGKERWEWGEEGGERRRRRMRSCVLKLNLIITAFHISLS